MKTASDFWRLFAQPRAARGCAKSHFLYYKSPPEARMASIQSDFFDFLGLFTQPLCLHQRFTLLGLCKKSFSLLEIAS